MHTRTLLTLLVFVPFFGIAGASDMPVGIPAPEFGITETVESTYGSADYFTYYIDANHAGSTDESNPFGSKEKPRKTIPRDFEAGDVVLIAPGDYSTSIDRFYLRGRGTKDKPIFIRGTDPNSKPRFKKKIHIVFASWFILENIALDSAAGGIEIRPLEEGMPSNHVAIRNTDIVGLGPTFKGGQAFSAHSRFDSSKISDIVFFRNTSQTVGDYNSPVECDTSSFSIQHRVRRAWILENTGYRSGGDGVILAHGANFSTSHIYIGRNNFYEHRENGIDLKEANDVVVSENVLHGFKPSSSSSGEAIVVHYEPTRIWILNNEIYDSNLGVVTTGSIDTHVIGNVIRDIHKSDSINWDPTSGYASGAAIHFRGGSSGSVINNTIVRSDVGLQLTSVLRGIVVNNNVFYQRSEKDSFDIRVADSKIAAITSAESNFFDDIRVLWSGYHETLSSLQTSTDECQLCRTSSTEQFVTSAGTTFLPQSHSVLVDAGVQSEQMDRLIALYGARFDRDIRGASRLSGNSIDIGAVEYESGPLPKAPASLAVD